MGKALMGCQLGVSGEKINSKVLLTFSDHLHIILPLIAPFLVDVDVILPELMI